MTTFAMPAPHPVIGALLTAAAARHSRVEVTDTAVVVQLGLAWRVTIPRTSIVAARREARTTLSAGAHGWRGRWLVNTVGRNLVNLTIDPAVTARLLGVPVTVRDLAISLEDPAAFLAELDAPLG